MTNLQGQFSPVSNFCTRGFEGFDGQSKFVPTAYNAVGIPNDFVDCKFDVTNFSLSPRLDRTVTRFEVAVEGGKQAAPVPAPAGLKPHQETAKLLEYLEQTDSNLEIAPWGMEAGRPTDEIALSIEENLTSPHCAVDSMQIWIPVECRGIGKRQFEKATPIKLIECNYDKACLQDSWVRSSTGEVVKLSPAYLHQDKHLSFQTGYAFKQMIIGNQEVYFISIGLHSKLLGTDYFKSINQETIYKVWQTIIEQGIVEITFENFLKCYVHQIDLKTDSIQDDVNTSLDLIEANIREDRSFKRYDQALNQGIQLGSRKDNQVSIHFYNKALQFKNDPKSSIFLEKVLKFEHPRNILRTEITLYAKQFFNDFEMNGEKNFHPESQITLENVLNKVESMGQMVMKKYLAKAFKLQQINVVKMEKVEVLEDALSDQIKFGVELCLTSSMTLADTEKAIIKLLKPGINKTPKVLRLTRYFYTIQTKVIDIDVDLKQAINL